MAKFASKAEPRYLALIGDLVGSRASDERQEAQETLLGTIRTINADLAPRQVLAAEVALTAGDEIQALLRRPEAAVDVMAAIGDFFYGATSAMVFGLGLGELSTGPIGPAPELAPNVAHLDGSCFHAAREALERARHRKSWACVEGLEAGDALALESLFELMGAIRKGWANMQGNYAYWMRRKELQKEVAELKGVSPSVVSESLRAAHYEAIRRGEDAAKRLLQRALPEPGAETP